MLIPLMLGMAQRTARKLRREVAPADNPTATQSRGRGRERSTRAGAKSARAPRAIWSGTISFGMVSIPVRLYTATESHDVHFHLLHKRDGVRLQNVRWCPKDEKAVPWNEVVRGFEYAKGNYLPITDEDLENLSDSFDPQRYHDEYQDALKKLIDARVAGAPLPAPPSERGEKIVDLMEALRASVEATRKKSPGAADGKAPATRTRTISSRR